MKQEFDVCCNCKHLKTEHVGDIGECFAGDLVDDNSFYSDYQECRCKRYAD